jgi:lipoyl(octanoyl) transferase
MSTSFSDSLLVYQLGLVDYNTTFEQMRQFTTARQPCTQDEIWLCEHPPTFTQGLAGAAEHILAAGDIPVIKTDRGGQVTFHGPGQLIAYPLIDLKRAGYFVKEYVYRIEESIIRTLRHLGITGHRIKGAPGIYVVLDAPFAHQRLNTSSLSHTPSFDGLGKIAALGIKVSNHCTYHGASLNVSMDLQPFRRINPCGYSGLQIVDLSTMGVSVTLDEVCAFWVTELTALFTNA